MSDDAQDTTPEDEQLTRSGELRPPDSGAGALPCESLGDFELLSEIGRGGMGVVFEARQISLKRRVALKVLPPGLGLTDQAVMRFEREAQTAAKLHHSHIVPVYATGADAGYHYYAMELIDGQSLSEVVNDLRGDRSSPLIEATPAHAGASRPGPRSTAGEPVTDTSSLSDTSGGRQWFDTLARLLADAGDALHYAHQQGVIHRDIKPANLLISADGRLCVTDFGLARMAEEPGMTLSGSFLGTPAYMSPEQVAAGRVKLDHRTDVYSLGAVLYEMLTLQRPFPGDSREQVLTAILSKDPKPLRRLNPRIPQDLETICLKAMEKDPDRRYGSAEEMAADLRQFLGRGLIAARRAGPVRRAMKLVHRHPLATTVAVAAVVVVALGALAWESSRARQLEEAHRALADARVSLGDGEYRDSLRKVDEALGLDPELAAARLVRARALMSLHRTDEAVEEARSVLERNPEDLTAQLILVAAARREPEEGSGRTLPLTGSDLASSAGEQTGDWESRLPESSDAYYLRALVAESSAEAVDLLDRSLELDPGNVEALVERIHRSIRLKDFRSALGDCERLIAARPRSAEGRALMAKIHTARHDPRSALTELERAIDIEPREPMYRLARGRLLQAAGQTEPAIADFAAAIAMDSERAASFAVRAQAYHEQGDFERAAADAQRAFELDPANFDAYRPLLFSLLFRGDLAQVEQTLTHLFEQAATWSDRRQRAAVHAMASALALLSGDVHRALAESDRAIEFHPENPALYVARAAARKALEGEPAAEEDCRKAASIELTDPEDLYRRARMFTDMSGQACRGRETALDDYSSAIEIAPGWADAYFGRGEIYRRLRRHEEARADFDRAIELAPSWAEPICDRADIHHDRERFTEALADFEVCAAQGGNVLGVVFRQAESLVRLGRVDEAIAYLQDLEGREGRLGVLGNAALIVTFYNTGRIDEALEAADRGVERSPEAGRMAHWGHLQRAHCLVEIPGRCAEVMADLRKVLELAPSDTMGIRGVAAVHADAIHSVCPEEYDGQLALGLARQAVSQSPGSAPSRDVLGWALYRHGHYDEAREALLQAYERHSADDVDNLLSLAMTSRKLDRAAEARDYYARAVARIAETYPKNPGFLRRQAEAAELLGIRPSR